MAVMVFRPRVDWWVWAVGCFALTAIVVIGMVFPWWLTILYGVAIMSGLALGMVGIWYAIEDKNIVVSIFPSASVPYSQDKGNQIQLQCTCSSGTVVPPVVDKIYGQERA